MDDTLYPLDAGLSVVKNIKATFCGFYSYYVEFMVQKLGIKKEEVHDLLFSLYKCYGTTMAGLKAIGYNFGYDDYHSFVHGRLPYELLKPDPVLRNVLLSLPIRKVIFTNGDRDHASRVLSRLGLEDCFEEIICFETLNPVNKEDGNDSEVGLASNAEIFDIVKHLQKSNEEGLLLPKTPIICKPYEDSFERAFKIADIRPGKTLFFDDSIRNLEAGKRMGLHTVLVGKLDRPEGVDYALEDIHNLREAVPELWEANEKTGDVKHSKEIGLETSVLA
ncbi:hypothetical protein RJ641_032863 [Dillenia turbinata]|uniref:Haloacid dehalogenase-like hydrolase (HAD) superfamily protein n=1 Tax=Dillenia turbinata TaxID=194707 RepID=A0AAN8VX77_9MAGN